MSTIYTYEWTGKRTGWNYKLEIYAAGTTPLSDITYVKLPQGCIEVNKRSSSFDKKPVGINKTPTMELTVYMSEIDDSILTDFAPLIYNPYLQIDYPAYEQTIHTGTVFVLKTRYNLNADESVNLWRTNYIGVYRNEFEVEFDPYSNIAKLKVEHALRATLDSLSLKGFENQPIGDYKNREYYLERIYAADEIALVNGISGVSLQFRPKTDFNNYLQTVGRDIYRKIVRDDSASFSLTVPTATFYKQNYNLDDGLGVALTESDLWMLTKMTYDGDDIGGAFSDAKDEKSLYNIFQNSAWDFLSDIAEQFIKKIFFHDNHLVVIPAFSHYGGEGTYLNLDVKKLNSKPEIKLFSGIIKTVTASLYESYDDDFNKVDITVEGSRNEDEFPVPIVFNNIPAASEWKRRPYGWSAEQPHCLNVFYIEDDTDIVGSVDYLALPHEWVKFQLDYTTYSDSIISRPNHATDAATIESVPKAHFLAIQQQSCASALIAKIYKTLFSKVQNSTMKIEVDFEEYTYFAAGGGVGFPWDKLDTILNFDLTEINSNIPIAYTQWIMTKYDLDYANETATLEFILKPF